jgi:poly(hydroxyalkanoate) depolymerase family esterase
MKLGLLFGGAGLFGALVGCADAADSRGEDVGQTGAAITTTASALEPVASFGTNPAGLTMYRYVPQGTGPNAPLVVLMHGCMQGATDMVNAGWNTLADKYKFHVVYPEQTVANNPYKCFNWAGVYGNPANLKRGQGENESIKEMVDKMKADYQVDPKRVFAVGFSSGGAEAALMLATWPDVFAAGATFGGIPYDCAESVAGASSCMKPGKDQDAKTWGDLVHAANSSFTGTWPRLSIWQGTADATVDPSNTKEMMRQWTSVHGVAQTPSASDAVAGYPHDMYKDPAGNVIVETFAITGMDHGVFVDPAGGCGTAAPYVLDAKVCSAAVVATFFGIGAAASPVDGGADGSTGASSGGVHDAGKPGSGGYGSGSSGGVNGATPTGAGALDAGVFGGGIAPGSGLAGCSVGNTRGSAGFGALGFGALFGLAVTRRRSRKMGK